MMEIKFTRSDPWSCPSCGFYYIQDRVAGKDIYGHETYEYALFRKCPFQVIRRFRTRKQAYEYVSNITGFSRWDLEWNSPSIVTNDREYLGVIYNMTMYRISKRTREVATRPVNDEQLSGWYMKYAECVSAAKQLINEQEDKSIC